KTRQGAGEMGRRTGGRVAPGGQVGGSVLGHGLVLGLAVQAALQQQQVLVELVQQQGGLGGGVGQAAAAQLGPADAGHVQAARHHAGQAGAVLTGLDGHHGDRQRGLRRDGGGGTIGKRAHGATSRARVERMAGRNRLPASGPPPYGGGATGFTQ